MAPTKNKLPMCIYIEATKKLRINRKTIPSSTLYNLGKYQ